jgi:hypothetical protein
MKYGVVIKLSKEFLQSLFGLPDDVEAMMWEDPETDTLMLKLRAKTERSIHLRNTNHRVHLTHVPEATQYPEVVL